MMHTSDTIAKIAPALVAALGEIEGAAKKAKNPAFRSCYADLESVIDASRDILTKNGLCVIQSPGLVAEGRLALTTRILHTSAEWVESVFTIPLAKIDPQGVGSATTYARRYALMAMLNMPAVDDDGEAAMDRSALPTAYAAKKTPMGARAAELANEIKGLESRGACMAWGKTYKGEIEKMPANWQTMLRKDMEAQLDFLKNHQPPDEDTFPGDLPRKAA